MQAPHDRTISCASFDWSQTDLGDHALWPHTLRLTVDIVLGTPLPMLLVWGSERVVVYNEAYAQLAGPDHPPVPGGSVPALWPAALEVTMDALDAAWQGRSSVERAKRLAGTRAGGNASFDLHFTPIADESGQVQGVLCALAPAAPATTAPARAPLRVLVVEDNPDAQYLVCEMLRALGHLAEGRGSGEEALALLADMSFDVLFTDVSLPGMSGIELARTALKGHAALSVVFASGFGQLPQGGIGFAFRSLQKPYELEQLQATLASIAAQARTAGQ
jgi:CheY-like chemotaxis protein